MSHYISAEEISKSDIESHIVQYNSLYAYALTKQVDNTPEPEIYATWHEAIELLVAVKNGVDIPLSEANGDLVDELRERTDIGTGAFLSPVPLRHVRGDKTLYSFVSGPELLNVEELSEEHGLPTVYLAFLTSYLLNDTLSSVDKKRIAHSMNLAKRVYMNLHHA